MAASLVDRNLLLGFLALQNDFVSREELIASVSVWLQDKSRSLNDIFDQRGVLAENENQLLQSLVEVHLAKHGGDVEKTLTGLHSPTSLREDLARLGDCELENTLTLLSSSTQAVDSPDTETVTHGAAAAHGHRFHVLRAHAQGGLGEVFVARDEELNREVALKEIQPRYADNVESRSRFVLEAQITGGLEHPGIVPVYGLGHYNNGRPYYAMRLIRGESLKQAIDQFHVTGHSGQTLQFRKLLSRFVDVCNAIQYAHSRGVLHRDLKPGNVMLGKYGETLVVDWGLAKIQGRDEQQKVEGEVTLQRTPDSSSAPTQMGSAIGTPAFMSPEQAAGQLDEVGPASDTYSLGATLYYLLTGKPPATDKDLGSLLRKVQTGDFPPPRRVDSSVPKGLEAICLKAMATNVDDRYESPEQLAGDVEKWLADESVSAQRDSIAEIGARWMRRHRSWTLSVATALALVTAVSTVAVLFINRSRENEAEQKRTAENLLQSLIAVTQQQEALNKEKSDLNAKVAELSGQLSQSVSGADQEKLKSEISRLKSTLDAKDKELTSARASATRAIQAGARISPPPRLGGTTRSFGRAPTMMGD
jgi:serine/threonine-protein kinase